MCGICGTVGPEPVDRDALARMTDALEHRGPDDDGFFVEDGSSAVGLGFRRLSIIDLDTGNQPLSNEDGSVQLVCNGEIYNYRELRRELESRGHRFATSGDIETIAHLYEDEGGRCVERLNGMLALALLDRSRRELLLARDRLGKKPLYYADLSGTLLFGQEIKALLEHPRCPRELDLDALAGLSDDAVIAALTALPGLGRWTADWFLARHLARPHAWPAGDLGVRKAVSAFYADGRPLSIQEVRTMGERFAPFQNLSAQFLLVGARMAG